MSESQIDLVPLSFNQQRLWFLDRLLQGSSVYNFTTAFCIKGPLNYNALEYAFTSMFERHEILRTKIKTEDDKAYQYITEHSSFFLKVIQAKEDAICLLMKIEGSRPFDLEIGPLIRSQLIHCDTENHILQITLHHIIADHWSMKIFFSELSAFYRAYCENKIAALPELSIQYADFSIWQREWLQGTVFEKQLKYWQKYLHDVPTSLQLPIDKPRPDELSYHGKIYSQAIHADLLKKVKSVCQDLNATPFMFLFAVYQILLYRYSHQEDIVVGCPIANRHYPQVEGLIGFFANTLVIRTKFHHGITAKEVVHHVKTSILNAYDYQDIPFEQVVDFLKIPRNLNQHPVFQTMFLMEEEAQSHMNFGNVKIEPIDVEQSTSKFDLTLTIKESSLQFEYATDLFEKNTILRMANHFINLLQEIVADPTGSVSDICFLTEKEISQFLVRKDENICKTTLSELFERQVEKTPRANAIVFEDQSFTYEELNSRANQWAHYLRSLGVKNDTLVAISLDRSAEMIIAIIGILKAGGAYVPIDPNYPIDRINFILDDTQAMALIASPINRAKFSSYNGHLVTPDQVIGDTSNLQAMCSASDLAYIIYTSGSTGKPKGVMIEHKAVTYCIHSMLRAISFNSTDCFLALTSFSFDVSVLDYFLPFCLGAQVVIGNQEAVKNPYRIAELIQHHAISCMQATPTTYVLLENSGWENKASLKMLIAGEALPASLAIKLIAKGEVYNIYGPTEATIYSTLSPVINSEKMTIGYPLSHVETYILDKNMQLVPYGVIGELHIGGLGLAKGYLNRLDLNAEKFIFHSFNKNFHTRLYKTGDLARLLPDGQIEFLGRIDDQVKIRGYRIELGEISSALRRHQKIKDAVVIAKQDQMNHQRLVAYIISHSSPPSPSDLREYLETFLPEYMIPSAYVPLTDFPVNSNGKLDKAALPMPENTYRMVENECILPRTDIEKTIIEIWSELLHVKNIGIHDNFFHIGGDSIISIQFVSRAKQKGIYLELKQIFKTPTVAALAHHAKADVSLQSPQIHSSILVGEIKLTPIQQWFFEQNFKCYSYFNQAIYLEATNVIDSKLLEESLKYIVEYHGAFKIQFLQTSSGWIQKYSEEEKNHAFSFVHSLESVCNVKQMQESLNIHQGPLFRAIFLSESKKVFLVIHHLIVDGISWRILLKDLEVVYRQLSQNKIPSLPEKTSSYQEWSNALHDYAQSELLKRELPYWNKVIEKITWRLPTDFNHGQNVQGAAKSIRFSLDEITTNALLKEAPKAYRTQINDILLTALVLAFGDYLGHYTLSLSIEGHGREVIDERIDVSRTVGWFTSLFPQYLCLDEPHDIANSLKKVKEVLREVPGKGIGYGILKYLTNLLEDHPKPQISFNYLGQWESSFDDNSFFKFSDESIGECSADKNSRDHLIEILVQSREGCLHIEWMYSENHFYFKTIEKIGNYFVDRLQQIVHYCCQQDHFGFTPSDFLLSKLDQETLDRVFHDNPDVEEVYPLTAMQEGILFGTLQAPETDMYMIQALYECKGYFNQELLQRAWKIVTDYYPILRTSFLWENVVSFHQVVSKNNDLIWHYHDYREVAEEMLDLRLKQLMELDRKDSFVLSKSPLSRQHWIEVGENHFFLLWTKHHIILDGWSDSLILQKVIEIYEHFLEKKPFHLPLIPAYKEFVSWTLQQDRKKAEIFWRDYLRGIDEPTHFNEVTTTHQSYSFSLTSEETATLLALSKRCDFTLNTILQGAWSIFLSKYLQKQDFVMGLTVSGRSIDLPQMEEMAGLFIQTLPFRVRFSETETVFSFFQRVQEDVLLVQEFGFFPLGQLQKWSQMENGERLFDNLFLFENFPSASSLTKQNIKLHSFFDKNEYPLTIGVFPTDPIKFLINTKFSYEKIVQMISCLREVLNKVALDETVLIQDISILNEKEEKRILIDWNQTFVEYPCSKTLHLLFEEQAEKTPHAIACVFKEKKLTYRELNCQINRFAYLLRRRGVIKEQLVCICLERSLEMIIALFGILKAGGAYVPLDPSYPAERLSCILQDTKSALVVTETSLCDKLHFFQGEKYLIDQAFPFLASSKDDEDNVDPLSSADNLAYVIYTSGSTGVPKGVCIQHRAIVNRIIWMQKEYNLCCTDKVLQKTPYCFDVSVWEFFWPLLVGAELHIAPPGSHLDPYQLIALIQQNSISHIHFVPSMLRQFLQTETVEQCTSLKLIFSSGEALTCDLEREFFLKMKGKLHNLYGPTEAAIDVTHWECKKDSLLSFVPIGKPIANTEIYILDAYLKPVPVGVCGQLHIGGVGLARGYLNQEEVTQSKFIKNPFSKKTEARLYKTGDLARYLPDGNIEYLGRLDHQVKIRGFRIELGEIESILKQHEHIKDAVVIANQKQQLCAYIISKSAPLDPVDLRSYSELHLPFYMIPSVFVFLESYPLTSSGKLNKKALPKQEDLPSLATLPATDNERILVEIWSKLLGVKNIGVQDNFFHLGGDSIISIQAASLARQKGIYFEIKQIFETPTIAGLLCHAKKMLPIDRKYDLKFEKVEFTPIQLWFFEQALVCFNHYNQSVLLAVRDSLDIQALNKALQALVRRHEVLQLKYTHSFGQWQQEHTSASKISANCANFLAYDMHVLKTHQSINIESGELFKATYFPLQNGKAKLLLVIHHLVIDGVSWRILLRDLEALYQGKTALLPAKTTPFHHFSSQLKKFGHELQNELPFWLEVIGKNRMDFPVDYSTGSNTHLNSDKVFISLNEEETISLLREAPSAYRTEINDLLLTALVLAKKDWRGGSALSLSLEGHGRENIDDTIDVSQTLGWFTSLYPVFLNLDNALPLGGCITSIKEQLRKIPKKGIGYGVLKYIMKANGLYQCQEPQIIFNYLGQWARGDEDSLFCFAKEYSGPSSAAENSRSHLIGINAEVKEGRLTVGFKFSTNHYRQESISKFAMHYQRRLQQIIDHCLDENNFGCTPSDFPLANLTQNILDQKFGKCLNIEEIYPLGPMQESLFFHTLYEKESDAYQIQTLLEIKETLDLELFQEAFKKIIKCHSILRTAFFLEGLVQPLQVVFSSILLPWSYQELENEQQLHSFLEKDRNELFDLTKAPLFRIHLILLNKKSLFLAWTRHHIILDGWSAPLIIKQVMEIYKNHTELYCRPYKDYITWLLNQDKEKAKIFWRNFLKGYRNQYSLKDVAKQAAFSTSHQFCLTEAETDQLIKNAQENSLTLSSVIHGAWGLFLNHYLQTDDIIFGCTISGRSIDLPDVAQMAGLFIHTLPFRIQLVSEDTILSYLKKLQEQMILIQEYATLSLSEIQTLTDSSFKSRLFDNIIIFENYPKDQEAPLQVVQNIEKTEFSLTVNVKLQNQLYFTVNGCFDSTFMHQLGRKLKKIFTDVIVKAL